MSIKENSEFSYQLETQEGRLQLIAFPNTFLGGHNRKNKIILCVEFVRGPLGYRIRKGGGLKQAIAKAIGLKSSKQRPTVLDATAGLGEDAFVLASLGCSVQLIERSPIIAALLEDGLKRAKTNPVTADIGDRMKVINGDSLKFLSKCPIEERPEIIYLDPMFPERQKSALNKVKMRLLRDIVGEDLDADDLLTQSLLSATKRVVVKRPKGARMLMDKMPTFQVDGKSCRFDVYIVGKA